jgi:hypothetical protein
MDNLLILVAVGLIIAIIALYLRSQIQIGHDLAISAGRWKKWFDSLYPNPEVSETIVGPGAYMFSKGIPRIVFLREKGEIHLCNLDQTVKVFDAQNLLEASVQKHVTTSIESTSSGGGVLFGSLGISQSRTTGEVTQSVDRVWLELMIDDPNDPIHFIRFFNEETAEKWLAITKILLRDANSQAAS